MFRSSDQLSRLPVFLSECVRKKTSIEAQLSSAVRTQVDETRLGLQMLNEAAAMMHKMRSNFAAIDQYCKDCKVHRHTASRRAQHLCHTAIATDCFADLLALLSPLAFLPLPLPLPHRWSFATVPRFSA